MDHREQLPIGAELVGDYRIDGVLGQGGFGITYKAWHLGLDKFVAVKEYFPSEFAKRDDTLSLSSTTPKSAEMFDWGRKRFLDEAKTLAKFGHPSIVRVYHVFEALNTAYMVLEYEDGLSLRHWLDDLGRPATQAELDGIVSPLLDALAAMHAADFIHRDIAPDNIIIRPNGTPVLLDFGAARQAIAAETKTLTGIVKSGYSPPEQYLTDASLQGPWTDAYALGATLYRVVTGAAPPEAPARQMHETYEPAAVASLGEYRPAFLEALDWALKLKINKRPQSILAFQDALSGGQKESERVAIGQAVGGKQRVSERAPQPPRRNRGPALKWAAVAAAMIVGTTGGYFVYQHLEAERQRVQALPDARAERIARMAREAKEPKRKAEALRRADERAWQQAKRLDTLEAYNAYLKSFPNGIYKDAVLAKVAALEAEAKRKVEAFRKHTADAFDCATSQDLERRITACTGLLGTERLSRAERARAYFNRGNAYGKNGQFDRAIADNTQAIQIKPRYAVAYYNRGLSYHRKGQYDRAIADYTQAIQIKPRYASAYNNRGFTYSKKGQFDRAIADYTQAIQIKPRYASAYNNRGVTYRRKGYRRRAIADYRKALQIDPSHKLAKKNLKALGVRP